MSSPLFEVLEEIGARIANAASVLFVLDFDGTITPIVEDPKLVRLDDAVRATLRSLHERGGASVVVFSGRERADLQTRVGVPGLIYAGNHGLEISGPGLLFVDPTAADRRPTLERLVADLNNRLKPFTGIRIEDKGLTISVHYRHVASEAWETVRQHVHSSLANATHPFQLTMGELAYEVRPRVNWNRNHAVHWIREQVGMHALPFFLGDDASDEEVFTALTDGITIKVGEPKDTAALYHVANPSEAVRFLDWADRMLPVKPLVVA